MLRTAGIIIVGSLMAVGVIGAGRSANYVTVEGEVVRIERKCNFTITEKEGNKVKKVSSETDLCNSTEEFSKYKENPDKRPMDVSGKATVKVSYKSPVDQSEQMGTLTYTGRDEEFYRLKAHDAISIRVPKSGEGEIKAL